MYSDDGFEVWLTKPSCEKMLPLRYFMGKEYEEYDTDESDQLPLFTTDWVSSFGDLFSATDVILLNHTMRSQYNSLLVKRKFYQKKGPYDEEVEVPVQYTIRSIGIPEYDFTDTNTFVVDFTYEWDGVIKNGHSVTSIVGMPPINIYINVDGDEVTSTINEELLDAHTVLEFHLAWIVDHWVVVGEPIRRQSIHHTTKIEIVHHNAERKISRELTLGNMQASCLLFGLKHKDEWKAYKAIAEQYNDTAADGGIANTVDVTRETLNATDVESGSIKNENLQTPNGWKQVETPSGASKTTTTNSRTPNNSDGTFYGQTKSEVEDTFQNYKRETEQQGTMSDDTTVTFNNHTHTQNGTYTEKGFRGRDLGSTLQKAFNRKGLEWLDRVVQDLVPELLIMCESL